MDWLKPRLRDLGKTGAGLAKALNIPKSRVYEMQRGDRRLQLDEVEAAARYLEMAESELLRLVEPGSAIMGGQIHQAITKPPFGRTLPPLIVWKSLPPPQGRPGGIMLRAQKDGEVPRPEYLEYSEKAFALKVLDDANAPVFRPRNKVVIDPETTALPGEDCYLGSLPTDGKDARAILGTLVRSTAALWIITQHNRRGEIEVPKSEYPSAWAVVANFLR